ncbi:MAG: M42 family peptidase [Oscillospiraceae bacterium]|nr:M42 family peptidase [Oscillospiraceae bacterium]
MDIQEILLCLNDCHGPSGDEEQVAQTISRLAAPFCREQRRDPMGNLICHIPGPGPRVLLCAHMDSVGMIVTHIEKEGFLRFGRLGKLSAQPHTPVRFASGLRGTLGADGGAKPGQAAPEELFIDVGAASAKQAETLVSIGDTAVYDAPVRWTDGSILAPCLSSRLGCAILLSVLGQLGGVNDLYVAFTVQRELGLRGAGPAAYGVDAQYALSVETTASEDVPGGKGRGSAALGKGAAVKVMDRSLIASPRMVRLLQELAGEENIPVQLDVQPDSGSDAGAVQTQRGGLYAGGICVPCRYLNSPGELARPEDAAACARLAVAFARADLEGRCH